MARPEEVFEAHRPLLLGLAYRLLGSMWDAEDVVQEAWVRWVGTDRATVRSPRAFLATTVTRLALDQLRSARVTREAYTGPWLPEPVPVGDGALGPLDTAELRDTVSYAAVHLLERLSPPERAVFVLREAFGLPYEEIAEVVGSPAATCRQYHHRARRRVRSGRDRFASSPGEHTELVARFLDAARSGDLAPLRELLSEDVVAWSDGGGKARAYPVPLAGREQVIEVFGALLHGNPVREARVVELNGLPAVWAVGAEGDEQAILFDVEAGRVRALYAVRNPDKLSRARP
ncbi:sigma-70 family RNA polymerase sigma factor [Streptomyces hoynatensis]|uniref:Sigma-70 family RNA polymerase sigma factor n=1 Tax=Streptomyces hoynatensis TaxID=1141874 RepID=A0A3A9YQZ7_9ACTN|nr:sigma-70 family RNA polymerase sigma factor [Streptomyces hoynatensis]